MGELWRRCSACKTPIELGAVHWVCSVSTCNRKRTGLVFCSVDCWEIHLPTERHREAWAVEARAPTTLERAGDRSARASGRGGAGSSRGRGDEARRPSGAESGRSERAAPRALIRRRGEERSAVGRSGMETATGATGAAADASVGRADERAREEILVVASRLKAYVREASGFNTSDRVLPVLSAALRRICDQAIRNARAAERQTVLDRDVPRD